MSLGVLALSGDGDVTERLLIPQVFEGGHHVGLEVVPSQTELLLVVHLLLAKISPRCNSALMSFMSKAVPVECSVLRQQQSLGNINNGALPLVPLLCHKLLYSYYGSKKEFPFFTGGKAN